MSLMDISISNESESACMNTAGSRSQGTWFYSAPTSPTSSMLDAHSGFQTEPASPKTYQDANSNSDGFEFETSRSFDYSSFVPETRREDEELPRNSLPTMAFADELFCDGKVLPLLRPLKLPPRLQNGNSDGRSSQSPTNSSPRSPSSVFRLAFLHRSLWNDDFDPFMVALENVKEEKRGKSKGKNGHRRIIRSLSPLRDNSTKKPNGPLDWSQKWDPQGGVLAPRKKPEPGLDGQAQLTSTSEEEEALKQAPISPKLLVEPKGLVFARHVRLVRMERGGPWRSRRKGVKRQKIRKFLFGNGSMEKATNQDKVGDKKPALLRNSSFLRKLCFRKSTQSKLLDEDESRGEETKMAMPMVCYKPRLFFCLGNWGRHVE